MRLHHLCGWGLALAMGAALAGLITGAMAAQAPATESSVGDSLRSLASRAGVVFVGQVTRIEPKGGIVEVSFAVQEQVVGQVGAAYTLREWGGLWTGGRQRYTVGQRMMIFLRTPSRLPNGGMGLSSPVDGMDGVVPVLQEAANATPMLDVRRLMTRVQRTPGSAMAGAEAGALLLPQAAATVSAWQRGPVAEPVIVQLPLSVLPRVAMPVGGILQTFGANSQGLAGTIQHIELGARSTLAVATGGPDGSR